MAAKRKREEQAAAGVAQLSTIFPSADAATLSAALTAAGGDVEAAVARLISDPPAAAGADAAAPAAREEEKPGAAAAAAAAAPEPAGPAAEWELSHADLPDGDADALLGAVRGLAEEGKTALLAAAGADAPVAAADALRICAAEDIAACVPLAGVAAALRAAGACRGPSARLMSALAELLPPAPRESGAARAGGAAPGKDEGGGGAAAAAAAPAGCPGGHKLSAGTTKTAGYECDACGRELPNRAPVRSCRKCDYDICAACAKRLPRSRCTKQLPKPKSVWAKGTGFGGDFGDDECGYYDYDDEDDDVDAKKRAAATSAASAREAAADSAAGAALRGVAAALRGLPEDPLTGRLTVECYPTLALLLAGPLPRRAVALLRNDSLMDVGARAEVYVALLDVLQQLSTDPALCEVLLMAPEPGAPSASDLLKALGRQSKVFLANKGEVERCSATDDDAAAVSVVMTVHDAVERVTSNAAAVQKHVTRAAPRREAAAAAPSPTGGEPAAKRGKKAAAAAAAAAVVAAEDAALRKRYEAAMEGMRFEMVDLRGGQAKWPHNYGGAIDKSKPVGGAARRMRELTTLSTSLPVSWGGGIFVRVDENRSDVLKALIIGPEDTPYQNGCFIFDIFLPSTYPNQCPNVHLMTTGGGKCRFNPNLYSCGKVCLSLLGTWDGPGWEPKTSTLLQVLISIQSLIMVPDPFYNEPGNESRASKGESDKYNRCIRLFTARAAILAHLEEPSPVFADVIRAHFALKRDAVAKQLDDWLSGPELGKTGWSYYHSSQLGSGPYGLDTPYGGGAKMRNARSDDAKKDFSPARVKAAVAAELKKLPPYNDAVPAP